MSVARLIATRVFAVSGATLVIATLAGCESGPNGKPLPYGESCGSIRSELRKLDNRGVPAKVEAVNAGRKLSSSDRQLANRYNDLLNQYLGARCHT
ncbi:MAG: hypothetical protein ACERJ2_00050 [Filomicrobium sp.]